MAYVLRAIFDTDASSFSISRCRQATMLMPDARLPPFSLRRNAAAIRYARAMRAMHMRWRGAMRASACALLRYGT